MKPRIVDGILYAPSGAGISVEGLLKKARLREKPAFAEPPSDQELIYLLRCAVEALRETSGT
jgi:hypothetical protein